jgi:hypothetical protein
MALGAFAVGFSALLLRTFAVFAATTRTDHITVLADNILNAGTLGPSILLSVFELILTASKELGWLLSECAL